MVLILIFLSTHTCWLPISFVIHTLPVIFVFVCVAHVYTSEWPLSGDCGQSRYKEDENPMRIIGGDVACLGEFPWMVRLGFLKGNRIIFNCGGSLISKYYVISAAHCSECDLARLGENYVDTDKDCDHTGCAPKHQDIKIRAFIYHENYKIRGPVYDFALVELDQAAEFNDFVQPICLPSGPVPREDLKADLLTIAGWGMTSSSEYAYPDKLMYILAPLIDNEHCDKVFKPPLLDHQMCIGYENGKDSCHEDSGGPVFKTVTKNKEPRAYLFGLVSFGRKCGTKPAVYTDVSYFTEWTLARIKRH